MMSKQAAKPVSHKGVPVAGGGFVLTGLRKGIEHIHVSVANRSYVLSEMTTAQAEQLVLLGWKYIRRV